MLDMKTIFDTNPYDKLFEGNGLVLRAIRPEETEVLKQAVRINNSVWGRHLSSSLSDFQSRTTNGHVLAAFRDNNLMGTISCAGGSTKQLKDARKDSEHPYNTWNGLTSDGTFANPVAKPDILFCVAVTTDSKVKHTYPEVPAGDHPLLEFARGLTNWKDRTDRDFSRITQRVAEQLIKAYCASGLDYVIRFHQRPKAGKLVNGAVITDILKQGRPDDLDSFGYNVIMQYPALPGQLPKSPKFDSVGEALVIAAAYLAARHPTLHIVMPYSRPAQFRTNLIKALDSLVTNSIGKPGPGFRDFMKLSENAVANAMKTTTSK